MNTDKSIGIACFTGAVLGAFLALQLNYFWWVGILIGGAVGYVLFRFKEAIEAARRAWRSLPDAKAATAAARTGIWNFVRLAGAVVGILCFAASIIIIMVGVAMSLVVGTEMSARWEGPVMAAGDLGIPPTYWWVSAVVVMLAALLLLACVLKTRDRKAACRAIVNCILLTPLVLPFTLAYAIGSAILPRAGKAFVRSCELCLALGRRIFILVHSEIRLLCMTDAMIGAAAGYYFGNALIGGIIGALCGLVNYRLVSVKWLKLAKV
jgi:hypothetical protein